MMPAADSAACPMIVALMGPTACGKTEAAVRIADHADVDIVSVDSAMVYRRLNIGTAKPSPEVLARYPHALVDIVEPADAYSAARFVADADAAAQASLAAGRTPILVGGSMLYFQAFMRGIDDLPAADARLRQTIAAQAAAAGWPAMHRELARRDPAAAARIAPANGARIQRALEVLELTGRSITDHWAATAVPATRRLRCKVFEVAILPRDRAVLHQRIAERLDAMLRRGLVEEVRALRDDATLCVDMPALRAVGYRQVWRYLDGCYDYAAMIARLAAATRQVAKRQLTWLRRWNAPAVADVDQACARILTALRRENAREQPC